MARARLSLRRLHRVGEDLIEITIKGDGRVLVLARDEVLLGDGDDEGARVALQGCGAEEVEALFFF